MVRSPKRQKQNFPIVYTAHCPGLFPLERTLKGKGVTRQLHGANVVEDLHLRSRPIHLQRHRDVRNVTTRRDDALDDGMSGRRNEYIRCLARTFDDATADRVIPAYGDFASSMVRVEFPSWFYSALAIAGLVPLVTLHASKICALPLTDPRREA